MLRQESGLWDWISGVIDNEIDTVEEGGDKSILSSLEGKELLAPLHKLELFGRPLRVLLQDLLQSKVTHIDKISLQVGNIEGKSNAPDNPNQLTAIIDIVKLKDLLILLNNLKQIIIGEILVERGQEFLSNSN